MAKVLVLYYSTYGHLETMAGAMADPGRLLAMIELAEQLAATRGVAGQLGG